MEVRSLIYEACLNHFSKFSHQLSCNKNGSFSVTLFKKSWRDGRIIFTGNEDSNEIYFQDLKEPNAVSHNLPHPEVDLIETPEDFVKYVYEAVKILNASPRHLLRRSPSVSNLTRDMR